MVSLHYFIQRLNFLRHLRKLHDIELQIINCVCFFDLEENWEPNILYFLTQESMLGLGVAHSLFVEISRVNQ